MRAARWPEAAAAAAALPDPLAPQLVTYYRLLSPGAARATEITAFMAAHPGWPQQALLARRRDEALAADADDAASLAACAVPDVALPAALLRCAGTARHAGREAEAATWARRAWRSGLDDPAAEAAFLHDWAGVVTPDDQRERFDRLAWSDPEAASRQAARLPADAREAAEMRLAFRRDDADAARRLGALPQEAQNTPALMLEEARWLRRAGEDEDALALWRRAGAAAEAAAPPARLPAFWAERNQLARRRLRLGDADGAYELAASHGQRAPEEVAEAEFLAGWIALRRRDDAATAARHFRALAGVSGAVITQARAHYWLGRAAAAQGDLPSARAEYDAAAAYPTTYYGQLAALARGETPASLAARLRADRERPADEARTLAFLGREDARAAALLVSWGEPRHARAFLSRLAEPRDEPQDQALAARYALRLGLPDEAVAIARRAGRGGVALAASGWPMPVRPPAGSVDPALALGICRQESSFDARALSPAGARGLMQLMPTTAQEVARRLGLPVDPAALVAEPAYNLRLGTAYLGELMARFGGVAPYAIAAYNAGPDRVLDWLAANGDAAGDLAGMIDWIELIPFNETRNYVQRVIENVVIYRAWRGETASHPLAPWRS